MKPITGDQMIFQSIIPIRPTGQFLKFTKFVAKNQLTESPDLNSIFKNTFRENLRRKSVQAYLAFDNKRAALMRRWYSEL